MSDGDSVKNGTSNNSTRSGSHPMKKRIQKLPKKCLINIISELNNNLKQNTNILVQMKESLSNLSLYQDEATFSGLSSYQLSNTQNIMTNTIKNSETQMNHLNKLLNGSSESINTSKTSLSDHDSIDPCVRPEIVKVEIRIVFLKIGEIDTIKEQFQAEAFIEAKWKEPSLNIDELDSFDATKFWNPNIEIENAVGDIKADVSYKIVVEKNDPSPIIYEMRKVKGTFLENLELYDFPVDVQDLSITLTTNRKCCELEFFEDSEIPSSINTQTFIDQQEWKLYDHVEVSKRVSNRDSTKERSKSPAISFTCHASRRPGYFYWNVYFLIFFITIMIFATFSVKPHLPQNRLQLGFTLLLTAVTFKFVVNRCLPTISYLTSLDKYVLGSMFLQCIICSWHSIISIMDELELYSTWDGFIYTTLAEYNYYKNQTKSMKTPKEPVYELEYYFDPNLNQTMIKRSVLTTAERYDRYAFLFFFLIYIFFHILFVLWMYFSVYKRRRLMKVIDREYLELVNRSKPVILEEFELSGSTNHLVYQNKVDMNDTTQKKGIKAMINAELSLNRKEPVAKRSYRLKPTSVSRTNSGPTNKSADRSKKLEDGISLKIDENCVSTTL